MEEFAARLRAAAERADLNQTDIARRLKIRPQSVQKWWTGKAQPRDKRLDTLAAVLGVSKAYLLGVTEADYSPPERRKNNRVAAERIPTPRSPVVSEDCFQAMAGAAGRIKEARDTLKRAAYRLRLDCADLIVENLERREIPVYLDDDDPFLMTVYPPGEDPLPVEVATPWYSEAPGGYRIDVHYSGDVKRRTAVPLPGKNGGVRSVVFVPVDPPSPVLTLRWTPEKLTLFGLDISDLVDCYDVPKLRARWADISRHLATKTEREPAE